MKYTFNNPGPQSFPLPLVMMKYVTENWSSKIYQKLIQTCKHFFGKHRILVVEKFSAEQDEFESSDEISLTGWVQSLTRDASGTHPDASLVSNDIDFSDKKLWIVGNYDFYEEFINLCFIKDYIYRCEYDKLSFNGMRVTYEDFKIISKTIKTFYAIYTVFEGPKEDEYLSIGDILAMIPQIVEFSLGFYRNTSVLTESSTNLLPEVTNLKIFELCYPKNFDCQVFCQFVQKYPLVKYVLQIKNYEDFRDQMINIFKLTYPQSRMKKIKSKKDVFKFKFFHTDAFTSTIINFE